MIDVRKTLENLHQILPNLSIEDLFRVLDNIVEISQFNVGQTTTIRRDNSGWRPYDTGTFISYASNGITLLVNNWNEKHPEYVLVHGMYSYVDNGQSKDMHMLTIFNKDNVCVCEYKGEDFIKLYNTLEEEWEDA